MRQFERLSLVATLLAAFCSLNLAGCATPTRPAAAGAAHASPGITTAGLTAQNMPPHPFMLFSREDIPALAKRRAQDPLLEECWTRLASLADQADVLDNKDDNADRWSRDNWWGQLEARAMIGQIRELTGVRKDGSQFPLELGVSDITLPNRRMFIGVVRDISEMRRIQRQLAEDAARLQRYHDESEREQELAMAIMERQVRSDWLRDGAVQYAVMPARNFSGDVVAVARSPQGALYAMLADATGHGLARR